MPNTLKTLWNGDFPLSQAFWHYAIAYGTIANILAQAAAIAAVLAGLPVAVAIGLHYCGRPRDVDARAGRGQGLQCRLPAPVARQPEAPEPGKPAMQKYGYGILTITFGPDVIYYHEGEMPGYQSFMGYDLAKVSANHMDQPDPGARR